MRSIVPFVTLINSLEVQRSLAMLFCCRRIGNCVSTFSGFVSRSREIWKKSVEFWVRLSFLDLGLTFGKVATAIL